MNETCRSALAVVPTALVLRLSLCFLMQFSPGQAFDIDSHSYLSLAEGLLRDHAFPSIIRTPGYPAFIAAVMAAGGKIPGAVMAAQCVLDSISAFLVVVIFSAVFFSATHGRWAGILYAVNPFAIYYANMLLSETLFTFILLAGVALLLRCIDSPGYLALAGASAIMALAVLVRPVGFLVPFFLSPVVFAAGKRGFSGLARPAFFLGLFLLLLVPWQIRNFREFGRWTASTIDDLNYFISFAPEALLVSQRPSALWEPQINEEMGRLQDLLWRKVAGKYGWTEDSPWELEGEGGRFLILRREADAVICGHPVYFAISHLAGTARVMLPYHPPLQQVFRAHWPAASLLLLAVDAVIIALFAGGLFRAFRWAAANRDATTRPRIILLFLLIAYFCLVPGIIGYSRFRIPALPYISVFAAACLGLHAGRRPGSAAPARHAAP